ncbi:MAG: SDR family oxidoreductase [Terracidiphilus sp.]|jgi:hypothetical protein
MKLLAGKQGTSNMAKPGTALITGASSGIGAAYADRLAKRGYDLVLVARSEERLNALAQQVAAACDVEVDVLIADLTSRAEVRLVERRLRSDAAITLLVNNAGIGTPKQVLVEDVDWLEGVLELNVVTVHRLAIAAAQTFAARGHGGIINVSSIAALHPEQVNATYTATKAFVLNLTQGLHAEAAPKGVKLQVVLPGATRTEFFNRFGVSVDERFSPDKIMEATDLVDAALAGFDQGELVTIPSLPDARDWDNFVAARLALGPNLSHSKPAARYGLSRT